MRVIHDLYSRPLQAHTGQDVFEALHRNIYRAFDYDSESDVYDTLAKSVTGDLLDDVYAEVHLSLVMQNEGGAVCKIQRVDVLEKEVLPPDDPQAPYFRLRARWKVEGKVGHHGHTHQSIADALGIPLGTVKTHLRRGLMRVRDAMQAPGAAPSEGR